MTDENKINKLVQEELTAMCIKHKQEKFNSSHEAWAVTMEEVEETMFEVKFLIDTMVKIKKQVFTDIIPNDNYRQLKQKALHAIQELIQVCACCDKAVRE